METETIDRLFLELSQVTQATTAKEIALQDKVRRLHILLARYRDEVPRRRELDRRVRRLHILLARYRDEVPLGHQPHMIAHLVDAELGRAQH